MNNSDIEKSIERVIHMLSVARDERRDLGNRMNWLAVLMLNLIALPKVFHYFGWA